MLALSLLISLNMLAFKQDTVEWINGRPLTWDLLGTIPLDLQTTVSSEHRSAFKEMREGEYGRAYAQAFSQFQKSPDDIWAWVLIESAKKQKNPNKLLLDLEKLKGSKATPTIRLLEFRAYHLAMVSEQLKPDRNHNLQKSYEDRVDRQREELIKHQPSHLPTVIALLNSQRTPVLQARKLTEKLFAESSSIEVALLKIRALVRGRYGYVTYQENDPRKNLPRVAIADPNEGPRIDEALDLLASLEKKHPNHALISYYRTMCFAFKNLFVPKTNPQYRSNIESAMLWANRFPKDSRYIGLQKNIEAFKKSGSVGVFSPVQDE